MPNRLWYRDPWIWAGLLIAVLAHAYVFFSGRYLPYTDWNLHVGLSAVLANGDETGADVFLERSFWPTPYYLFYVTNAFWSQFMPAEVGAKLNLLIATIGWVIGTARLAVTTGRHPRMCLIAPLALFGVPLGMGYAAFVFAAPLMLFALSDTETLLRDMREDESFFEKDAQRRFIFVAVDLVLVYLGHGLLFVFTVGLIGCRVAAHMAEWFRHQKRRNAMRALVSIALPFIPVMLLLVPRLYQRIQKPWIGPEFQTQSDPAFADWVSLSEHLATLPRDLLDRGGDGHGWTMGLAIGVLLVWIGAGFFRRQPRDPEMGTLGPNIYAGALVAVVLVGPASIGWPVTFGEVYARAAVFAGLMLFLLPRVDLSGPKGGALASLALVPVLHNAIVNQAIVEEFSNWATPYDEVRAAIPDKKTVLPISTPPVGPRENTPAARTLGYLHLADGAAYVPIGNLPEEVPVHRTNAPETPYAPSWQRFDPKAHGTAYDYLVLRGPPLIKATRQAGYHAQVLETAGWVVFKTKKTQTP